MVLRFKKNTKNTLKNNRLWSRGYGTQLESRGFNTHNFNSGFKLLFRNYLEYISVGN